MTTSRVSFDSWATLNDTIMGGTSQAGCRLTPEGLLLEGEVVADGGGFVSCRSPLFRPPLDLSAFSGLRLAIEAEGRTLKFAVACSDGLMGLTEMIPGGLRWVTPVPTEVEGTTVVEVAFKDLSPWSVPNRWDSLCALMRPQSRAYKCSIRGLMRRDPPIQASVRVQSDF